MEARTGAGGILVYPDRGVGCSCIPCPLKTLSLDSELAVLNSHFVSLVFVKCRALHTLYRKGIQESPSCIICLVRYNRREKIEKRTKAELVGG